MVSQVATKGDLSFFYEFGQIYRKIQTFLFVHTPIEVTRYFRDPSRSAAKVYQNLLYLPEVNSRGYSDYNNTFSVFYKKHIHQVNARTVVLVIGDARNNFRRADYETFFKISKKANNMIWINPEPREKWNRGDSIIKQYAPACDSLLNIYNVDGLRKILDSHPFEITRNGQRSISLDRC